MIAILALNQRNPLRLDPTRTTSIQKQFAAEMKRRFRVLRRAIFRLVVEQDSFGIRKPTNPFALLANQEEFEPPAIWRFLTDARKVKEFQKWFKEQVDEGVLEIEEGVDPEVPWTSKHTTSAYQRGVTRAFIDAKNNKLRAEGKAILDIESEFFQGTKAQFLETAFSGSVGTAQVEMLATRSFEMLKDVTAQMSSAMSRELSSGFSQGFGARRIARNLDNAIAQIDRQRSLRIARTEIVHAHSEGQLDAFDQLGVEEVGIMAEFSTAGDDLVCPLCLPLEGAVFTVKEARGVIPRHPNCIVGDSVVTSLGVQSLMRTEYTGEIIKFVTSKGHRLSVTPKHVLLTNMGFITAESLYCGDYLIDGIEMENFIQAPQNDARKTRISDTFRSLSENSSMFTERMPLAPEDLHNEGRFCNPEVDIVRPYSILRDKFVLAKGCLVDVVKDLNEPPLPLGQSGFAKGVLPGSSTLDEFLHCIACTFDSSMGVCRDGLAFLLSHLRHPKKHGFRFISGREFFVSESFVDYASGCIEPLRESVRTHPFLKELDDFFYWESATVVPRAISKKDARFLQAEFDRISFDTVLTANCGEVHSRLVQFDDIVSIERVHVVDLPVYDLSTSSTLYLIDGIISSNCRCAFIPVIPSEISKRVDREQRESLRVEVERAEPRRRELDKQQREALKTEPSAKKRAKLREEIRRREVLRKVEQERIKGPKTTKSQIEAAIQRSIRAERPAQSRSEAFRRSISPLADRKISKSRAPKGTR